MAEDSSDDREEAPTAKKLKDARKKGQIARSKELTTALLLMTSAITLYAYSSSFGRNIANIAIQAFTPDRRYIYNPKMMLAAVTDLASAAFFTFAPFFFILFIIGLVSPMALGGISFSTEVLAPKANRMSPAKGLKRMLGTHALIELTKALAKVSVVFIVGYFVLSAAFPSLVELGNGNVESSIATAMDIVSQSFFFLSFSLLLIAFIDVPYQIWNHGKELKMSKQEVKDEYKDSEGKPELKGKIKQKQREISQQRMMEAVPEADVVVTNPEHYSVALKYDVLKSGAPIVVAKGADLMALQIRKVAIANDVQILPMPPLARALYHTTEINQEVPQGLYLSVAQVLAFVFQLKSFRDGKGPRPENLGKIDTPKEFQY
ncbi:MAG: flagellar biosynthesis protein FlhB [Enterobacterales bacterium]|nr:flagellar biosynthesis protein FlhB [Enterobacterales bacterium]